MYNEITSWSANIRTEQKRKYTVEQTENSRVELHTPTEENHITVALKKHNS